MNPVMLDLETMGTNANSLIIAIGAVQFDPETNLIADTFYAVVDHASGKAVGMEVDPRTEEWWAKQDKAARDAWNVPGMPIQEALTRFARWIHPDATVWGNGADFDNAMLNHAYKLCGMETPWKFYNNRCYRTMKNMFPRVPFKRVGTYHNAVDDATSQALHLCAILQHLRAD